MAQPRVKTVSSDSFNPGPLNLGTTYYWKVAEVNNAKTPNTWTGDVWSFTTKEYLVVEDFESYNDDDNRIYDTWIDGYERQAAAARPSATWRPRSPSRRSSTAANSRCRWNTTTSRRPIYSEASTDFTPVQNWTVDGADTLSLYVHGQPVGFTETSGGHMVMSGTGTDIYNTADQGRFVYKQLTGDGTIIAQVDNLTNTNAWAKAGVMIRQSLDAGSSWAYSLASTGNGVHFQARLLAAGAATSDTTLTLPTSQTTAPDPGVGQARTQGQSVQRLLLDRRDYLDAESVEPADDYDGRQRLHRLGRDQSPVRSGDRRRSSPPSPPQAPSPAPGSRSRWALHSPPATRRIRSISPYRTAAVTRPR